MSQGSSGEQTAPYSLAPPCGKWNGLLNDYANETSAPKEGRRESLQDEVLHISLRRFSKEGDRCELSPSNTLSRWIMGTLGD